MQVGPRVRELTNCAFRPGKGTYHRVKNSPAGAETGGITRDYETLSTRAADAVEAALDVWEDAVEARDVLILEELNNGCRRVDVARWNRLSECRVTQILAAKGGE